MSIFGSSPIPPPAPGAMLVMRGETPNGGEFLLWRDPAKLGERFRQEMRRRNRAALDVMVGLARSRAPVDTGRLLNGITGSEKGDYFEFRASAISDRGQPEDYARFEEFGHAVAGGAAVSGNALVADESFFAGNGHWRSHRRARADAVPAQPFFFGSAAEGLASRGTPDEIIGAAAKAMVEE